MPEAVLGNQRLCLQLLFYVKALWVDIYFVFLFPPQRIVRWLVNPIVRGWGVIFNGSARQISRFYLNAIAIVRSRGSTLFLSL